VPSKDLREKHDAKKKEYVESRFREFHDQMNPLDDGNMPLTNWKSAVNVKCDECGYE
jgi:hypothetical protein